MAMPNSFPLPVNILPVEELHDLLYQLHGFYPRPEQIEAIKTLAIDQKDLILIARTGWGKSMIFQSIPAIRKGGIALMLMPLNLLEEDQAESIRKISGCIPCILNSQTNSSDLRQKILNGEFTHSKSYLLEWHLHGELSLTILVLMGPETALSDKFAELLERKEFQERLVLVAIDEVHVVQQWGENWREHYSQIEVLRHRIDNRVPWFATSATLDTATLKAVRESAGFQKNVKVIKTPIDRPDISLSIRRIEHTLKSFHDLRFLVDDAITSSGDVDTSLIPKTVVYMETITEIVAAEDLLIKWLRHIGCGEESANMTVQAYHALVSEIDKRRISTDFRRPGRAAPHRIILATDAMGMGIDNPDICLVIQWRQPDSVCTLIQRAGRAARGKNEKGKFLWLVESWCFGSKDKPEKKSQSAKKDMERRKALNPMLFKLINTRGCIRRCVLDFFGESMTTYQPPDPCCSGCSKTDLLPRPPPQAEAPRKSRVRNWAGPQTIDGLKEWRKTKAQQLFRGKSCFTEEEAEEIVMSTDLLEKLAKEGNHIRTVDDLRSRAGNWAWDLDFGDEVLEVITRACATRGVNIRALGEIRAAKKREEQRLPLR